jgi:hypothetical protein
MFAGDAGRCRERGRSAVGQEFNVIALIKGDERYVYVYDDASRWPLLDCFEEQAANPGLSLNWFDAVVLARKAREQAGRSQAEETSTPRF